MTETDWYANVRRYIPDFDTAKCREIRRLILDVTSDGIRMEAVFGHWKTPDVVLRFVNVYNMSLNIDSGIIELGEFLISRPGDDGIVAYDELKSIKWKCDKVEFVGLLSSAIG